MKKILILTAVILCTCSICFCQCCYCLKVIEKNKKDVVMGIPEGYRLAHCTTLSPNEYVVVLRPKDYYDNNWEHWLLFIGDRSNLVKTTITSFCIDESNPYSGWYRLYYPGGTVEIKKSL